VIVGSSIGYFIGHRIRESIRTIVVQVIGLATVIMGISNAMDTHNLVFPLVGMVIGAVIGELLHIEERLEGIGERLKKRFAKSQMTPAPSLKVLSLQPCCSALAP